MYKLIVLVLFTTGTITAQQDATNLIDEEFESLINESNNYQDYKVVKENSLLQLKSRTASYINDLQDKITQLEANITAEQQAQQRLKNELESKSNTVITLNQEKDTIDFLGFSLNKSLYNTLVWSFVGLLVLAVTAQSISYKRSKTTTDLAYQEKETAEAELERVKLRAIEEKQRLGRQLQDERNKLAKLKGTS